jgi:ABC-2 type transport system ATP-binding protein
MSVSPVWVKDLYRSSGGREILRGISFSVEIGESVGIVGPNLSGKSMLTKILAGELAPSSGEARIVGIVPWDELHRVRKVLGYLPEEELPLDADSGVEDYLLLAARLKDIPRGQRTKSIEYAIDIASVRSLLRYPLRMLSRGERRRVVLAQALLGDPKVLLLDAPFEGVDAKGSQELASALRQASTDRALIFATNRLQEASELCSRLLILSRGKIAGEGTPRELGFSQKAIARDQLRVLLPNDKSAASLSAMLAQINGAQAITFDVNRDGSVSFVVVAEGDICAQAVSLLVEQGAKVLAVQELESKLSAAYKALTQ